MAMDRSTVGVGVVIGLEAHKLARGTVVRVATAAALVLVMATTVGGYAAAMMPKGGGIANRPTTVPSMNSRPVLHDITTPTARSIVTLTLVAPRAV